MTPQNVASRPKPMIAKPPLRLSSSRLLVEIIAPSTQQRGSRFDRAGFITQVTLDSEHTFCTTESADGTGGAGLCNEFGITTAVGFEAAPPGAQFVKPGVGLLTRPDEKPYAFWHNYPVQPFPVHVEHTADCAVFLTEPLDCRGYALRLSKTLQVRENQLRIHYSAENVGHSRISVDEYRHNFIALDDRGPGPGQQLRLPFTPEPERGFGGLQITGSTITWTQAPRRVFHGRLHGFKDCLNPWWELIDETAGIGMRESTSFPWSRFALYGTARLLSPEAFVQLDLEPGQRQQWQRDYLFFGL